MGVEVAGSELPKENGGDVKTKLFDLENGKINFSEVITFGSHGVDELQSTGEANDASNASLPKDAVDEWPQVQTHYFYFVKHRLHEDPSLKAKIEEAEKEIQKKTEKIDQLYEDLRAKNLEKSELYGELNAFKGEKEQNWLFINEKRSQMKPLQEALGSLRGGGGGEKGFRICSTEEELNQLIRSVEYRMQHETMSLKEEKQLMKEIKELEATRPKVIAEIARRAEIQESLGQKEVLQDQVKLLGTNLDGVRKQQADIKAKTSRLGPQLDAVKKQVDTIYTELTKVKDQKNSALDKVRTLKNLRIEGNKDFNDSRNILSKARDIAVKKDVKALEELNNAEVEKFMSQWNSSKAFRNDYEKKILTSLDYRQLSRDGRIRNFDEKPLVRAESPRPSETDVVSKATLKQQKEVAKTTLKAENLPAEKAQKELKKGSKESKTASEQALEEDVFVVDKPKKDVSNATEISAEKLKEMKKEEEKEKQRQALERKKKMQDKAAAKAALRIQKEAEKKLKEREKKMRKKEVSTVQPTNEEEPTQNPDTDNPENSDDVEEVVETPAPSKAKVQQENALRHRKPIKPRGTLPKAILKKKKSDKYWLWGSAAAAAVLAVLLFFVLDKYLF